MSGAVTEPQIPTDRSGTTTYKGTLPNGQEETLQLHANGTATYAPGPSCSSEDDCELLGTYTTSRQDDDGLLYMVITVRLFWESGLFNDHSVNRATGQVVEKRFRHRGDESEITVVEAAASESVQDDLVISPSRVLRRQ